MAFSMIVEMTSLTPRVTLSTPAMPAHSAPATIATTIATHGVEVAGQPGLRRRTRPAAKTAERYWPSTPMLNRFIRKPIAAASRRGRARAVC